MKEIRLDSLSLFLILLFVLVISMVFMNWFFVYPSTMNEEGFVSFQQNKNPLEYVNVPQYSSTKTKIAKVYDNIFLDAENGNLIEVDSTTYTNAVDTSGSTIQKLWITCRDNAGNPVTSYDTIMGANGVIQTVDTPESKKKFTNSMTPYIYKSNSTTTNLNFVVYVPYNDNTFIHTITISNETAPKVYVNQNSIVYYHPMTTGVLNISGDNTGSIVQISGAPIPDTDASNNTFVILSLYDTSQNVFQMSKNTFFNPINGHFIIKSASNAANGSTPIIKVYDRNNTDITTTYKTTAKEESIKNVDFVSWIKYDVSGNKMCIYTGAGMKTVITIIDPTTDGSFQIFKVYRFGANGALDTTVVPDTTKTPVVSPPSSVINPPLDKDSMSDYYKWYWYWNTTGGSDMTSKNYSEDYLLKTQIIPPVCPSCPMCPNGGSCGNCNGIAGSSVEQTTSGNVVSGAIGRGYNSAGGVINNAIDTTGSLLYNTGKGVTRVGEDVVGGAVGLGRDTVGGAVGLTKDTVGGAVGLAKDTVGGAVGLAKDTVGGAVGLGREVVGGVLNMGSPVQLNNTNKSGYNNSYGGQGQTNQSSIADPYSYYGARPSSGTTNFIPVTADFSKFGR